MHDEPSGDGRARAERVRNALGQMGHTEGTRHIRHAPMRRDERNVEADKLHKWLSWLCGIQL